jgi:hypothetical protein
VLGSDWPIVPTQATIDALRAIPPMDETTNLPPVPAEVVEKISTATPSVGRNRSPLIRLTGGLA